MTKYSRVIEESRLDFLRLVNESFSMKGDFWKWRTRQLNDFAAAVNVYGCHKKKIYRIVRKCKARRIMRGLKHD